MEEELIILRRKVPKKGELLLVEDGADGESGVGGRDEAWKEMMRIEGAGGNEVLFDVSPSNRAILIEDLQKSSPLILLYFLYFHSAVDYITRGRI